MSFPTNPSCGTCRSRQATCDRTWGPAGCRRCAEEGLQCRRRIPRLKNSTGVIELTDTGRTTHRDRVIITSNSATASRSSTGTFSARWVVPSQQKDIGPSPPASILPTETSVPSTRQVTTLNRQAPTPPTEIVCSARGSATPVHPVIGGATYSHILSQPLTPVSPGLSARTGEKSSGAEPSRMAHSQLQMKPVIRQSAELFLHCEDPESIQASLLGSLSLDREVESNTLPFVLHSIIAGVVRFVFAPTEILSSIRDYVFQSHSFEQEARQRTLLISNMSLAISRTTDYDLTDYMIFQKQLMNGVLRARTCNELTREVALEVMKASHELLCAMWRVGSLTNVLHTMRLYAPIFRRACPESNRELVNFPRLLITPNIDLQYYATLDILQSFLTHRPMFFRYDLNFLSPQIEELVKLDQGPGLRWLYGIPNRVMLILARMNTLLEDYGDFIDKEQVRELEDDIGACAFLLPSSINADPALNMGRMMVQESWKLAAYVYLYMGLCGADSSDARVIQIQKRFMRALKGIKPLRNPDSFLVFPMTILGIATSTPTDRKILLTRLWGVSECTKSGTVGNNLVMMLRDVWLRTMQRPTIWADLRIAYSTITGM
ncbi:unnamed protein product [Rhizoctonia solani]|uniref:Zn(2)-C6 fungal-type domain-containing protein n=1 Tax=Rhizoctonia solani TaxID=456999 RepID=A0A8H3GBU1_9AGAM|nr:unnamed protein product [Rhizoctonia solani]